MPSVKVYNQKGEAVSEIQLSDELFSVDVSTPLVHQVVVAQQANKRVAIAHTKGRSEVRGGGKKPWRQKGTGRARHGSIRSPLWKGGGVTFGPTKDRNFSKHINAKMAKQALRMALTDRALDDKIVIVDTLTTEHGKTKEIADILKHLPIKDQKTLLLLSKKEKNIADIARNLSQVQPYKADSVQALTVVTYPVLLMTKESLAELTDTYGEKVTA